MSARSYTLNKKRQGNITVESFSSGRIAIFLHGNLIALKDESGAIGLSSCGWKTNTTKTAINRFLSLTGQAFSVYQKAGVWYLHDSNTGTSSLFEDGMAINQAPLVAALA